MKRTFIFLTLILLASLGLPKNGLAQLFTHDQGDPYMVEKIQERLNPELSDFPASVRRVAIYKINYSALRFTNEEIEYIRAEIEY